MELKLKSVDEIAREIGVQENGAVQAYFTNACYRYMDKYVPMDTGALRRVVNITSDSITYKSPYAMYQYYGVRDDGTHKVTNYTTPGTGPYWDKQMISAEKDDLVREVANYARRR